MREFHDDVATPRLADDHRTLEADACDEKFEVVCHRRHVETVIGLRTVAMAALVDGNHAVAELREMTRHAIPQPRIRREAVHEEKWGPRHPIGRLPDNTVEVEIVPHGVEFAPMRSGMHER